MVTFLRAAATDNKGQILSHILGVQEALEKNGDLPVNLHFVIEGEEEIGSGNLGNFLSENKEALRCDVVVVSDTGMVDARNADIELRLARRHCAGGQSDRREDGFALGSLRRLGRESDYGAGAVAGDLHDDKGHVAIEGFYDKVKPLEDWERKAWRELPLDGDEEILKETGAPALFGEEGYSTLERIWGRPTAEINGIGGGYQGVGTKTVIPSHAMAKLTFRLVPNQERRRDFELAKPASAKTFAARGDDGNH